MYFETTYRLEDFILNTKWEELNAEVQTRARVCMIDLMGALITGSRSEQFQVGKRVAKAIFGEGSVAAIGTEETFSFMGAAAAMGHASNAYDIDDGHNLIRAHPGTSFIGGVLAAAYEKDISYEELLATLVVAYETTIRMGGAIMEYYNFAHSSGTFGAAGTAAGVGRIWGFTREQMNHTLSTAEFHGPLVPGIRSVEYPSMNKDGVPFGVMVGALTAVETREGFQGNKHLLESQEHGHFLEGLGTDYEMLRLYFKPYACCRWAHPAIDSCLEVMGERGLAYEDVERVTIRTFEKATMLSKIVPKTQDEAQYNIAYPVAAAMVTGDFGLEQISEEAFRNPDILDAMKRIDFQVDEEIDGQFPGKRICRAEIVTKSGEIWISSECEPRGESKENIGLDWISEKFQRITGPIMTKEAQQKLLSLLKSEEPLSVRTLVNTANQLINAG